MIKKMVLMAAAFVAFAAAAEVTITGVSAAQRNALSGMVDIDVAFNGSSNDVANFECAFAAVTNAATRAEVALSPLAESAITGSDSAWTRHFVWDAASDLGEVAIDEVALSVGEPAIQLWENGPYWALCNVGASTPEDYGYYFRWGDTVGYKRSGGTWKSFDYYYTNVTWEASTGETMDSSPFSKSDCPTYGQDNDTLLSSGYIDTNGNLVAEHDAATAHLGSPWRMPTDAEIVALTNSCTATWTNLNRVAGRLVTGKGDYASKSIFLPAAGYGKEDTLYYPGSRGYDWSSTPRSGNSKYSQRLYFDYQSFYPSYWDRYLGQSVRAVRATAGTAAVVATTTLALDTRTTVIAANGMTFGACKIAGLDTTDPNAQFTAKVEMKDGKVVISWEPDLNTNATERIYKISGCTSLGDDWKTPYQSWHRFFKVSVAMPTGAAGETSAVSGESFEPVDINDLGVQLWEGGPYWAECNVGASEPEEYGYYFWWGDTVGYTRSGGTWSSSSSYYYYSGVTWVSSSGTSMSSSPFSSSTCPTYNKSISSLQSSGYIDATTNLVAKYDAATVHLGSPWRMPTDAEFSALISNCTTTWTTRNGVYGRLVTGKGDYASKSIFLPAAGRGYGSYLYYPGSFGYYWPSSPDSDYSDDAWYLRFSSSYFDRYSYLRYYGQSVRAVRSSGE